MSQRMSRLSRRRGADVSTVDSVTARDSGTVQESLLDTSDDFSTFQPGTRRTRAMLHSTLPVDRVAGVGREDAVGAVNKTVGFIAMGSACSGPPTGGVRVNSTVSDVIGSVSGGAANSRDAVISRAECSSRREADRGVLAGNADVSLIVSNRGTRNTANVAGVDLGTRIATAGNNSASRVRTVSNNLASRVGTLSSHSGTRGETVSSDSGTRGETVSSDSGTRGETVSSDSGTRGETVSSDSGTSRLAAASLDSARSQQLAARTCPVCQRRFGSAAARQAHLKPCGRRHALSAEQLVQAVGLQQRQAEERASQGLPTTAPVADRANNRRRRTPAQAGSAGSAADGDLQMALAVSASLHEETSRQQLQLVELGLADELVDSVPSQLTTVDPPKSSRDRPSRLRQLALGSDASVLTRGSEDTQKSGRPRTALISTSKESRERLVADQVSQLISWEETLSRENDLTASRLQKQSALRWQRASIADSDSDSYYVSGLGRWVEKHRGPVDSLLQDVSSIPGRLNLTQQPTGTDRTEGVEEESEELGTQAALLSLANFPSPDHESEKVIATSSCDNLTVKSTSCNLAGFFLEASESPDHALKCHSTFKVPHEYITSASIRQERSGASNFADSDQPVSPRLKVSPECSVSSKAVRYSTGVVRTDIADSNLSCQEEDQSVIIGGHRPQGRARLHVPFKVRSNGEAEMFRPVCPDENYSSSAANFSPVQPPSIGHGIQAESELKNPDIDKTIQDITYYTSACSENQNSASRLSTGRLVENAPDLGVLMWKKLTSGELPGDVLLTCRDGIVPAHRFILTTRCPSLLAGSSHQFSSRCITDFVGYLYTRCCPVGAGCEQEMRTLAEMVHENELLAYLIKPSVLSSTDGDPSSPTVVDSDVPGSPELFCPSPQNESDMNESSHGSSVLSKSSSFGDVPTLVLDADGKRSKVSDTQSTESHHLRETSAVIRASPDRLSDEVSHPQSGIKRRKSDVSASPSPKLEPAKRRCRSPSAELCLSTNETGSTGECAAGLFDAQQDMGDDLQADNQNVTLSHQGSDSPRVPCSSTLGVGDILEPIISGHLPDPSDLEDGRFRNPSSDSDVMFVEESLPPSPTDQVLVPESGSLPSVRDVEPRDVSNSTDRLFGSLRSAWDEMEDNCLIEVIEPANVPSSQSVGANTVLDTIRDNSVTCEDIPDRCRQEVQHHHGDAENSGLGLSVSPEICSRRFDIYQSHKSQRLTSDISSSVRSGSCLSPLSEHYEHNLSSRSGVCSMSQTSTACKDLYSPSPSKSSKVTYPPTLHISPRSAVSSSSSISTSPSSVVHPADVHLTPASRLSQDSPTTSYRQQGVSAVRTPRTSIRHGRSPGSPALSVRSGLSVSARTADSGRTPLFGSPSYVWPDDSLICGVVTPARDHVVGGDKRPVLESEGVDRPNGLQPSTTAVTTAPTVRPMQHTPLNPYKVILKDSTTPVPNYVLMLTPDLKTALARIGVKPVPRRKAVALLSHIYNETHPAADDVSSDKRTVGSRSGSTHRSKSSPARGHQGPAKRQTVSVPKRKKNAEKSAVASSDSVSRSPLSRKVIDLEKYRSKRQPSKVQRSSSSDCSGIAASLGVGSSRIPTSAALSPMKTTHCSPVRCSRISPMKTPHASPVRVSSVSPMKTPHASPVRVSSVSPMKSPHASPVRGSSVLPLKTPHTSLVRVSSVSPMKTPHASSVHGSRMSPIKASHVSPVPVSNVSPRKTPHASPIRCSRLSPMKTPHASPVRDSSSSPFKTPHFSPIRESGMSRDFGISPIKTPHVSPVRGSNISLMKTPHASPARGSSISPMKTPHASPVRCSRTSSPLRLSPYWRGPSVLQQGGSSASSSPGRPPPDRGVCFSVEADGTAHMSSQPSPDQQSDQESDASSDGVECLEETMLTHGDIDEPEIPASQAVPAEQLPDVLTEFIRARPALYRQILLYEPIWLEQLLEQLKTAGIKVSLARLTDFLDEQCITFRTAASANRRTRKSPKKKSPKKRRAAGKSQTNPATASQRTAAAKPPRKTTTASQQTAAAKSPRKTTTASQRTAAAKSPRKTTTASQRTAAAKSPRKTTTKR